MLSEAQTHRTPDDIEEVEMSRMVYRDEADDDEKVDPNEISPGNEAYPDDDTQE
jgi:hypothetical protein